MAAAAGFGLGASLPRLPRMDDQERKSLESRWLHLTRTVLPGMAEARGWPVRHDHCFQRILLDHACGGRWNDAIAGRPAYRNASDLVLARAIGAAEQLAAGGGDLPALNRQSLAWRGKA